MVAILINHIPGALPIVFPRTVHKIQHSKEMPLIASSDYLPKSMAEKNCNFLIRITSVPCQLCSWMLFIFFFYLVPTNTAHKPIHKVTHGTIPCQTSFSEKAVLESFDALFVSALEASRQSPSQLSSCYQGKVSCHSDCMPAQLWLLFSHKVISQFMWKLYIAYQI